jgi:hypothetical protein
MREAVKVLCGLALACGGAWLAGCVSAGADAAGSDPARAGAVAEEGREGGSGPAGRGDLFLPLDLPDSTPMRLASGAPGPSYWSQRVDYAIDATLDAERRRVQGVERITYTNNSPDELDYLWLNLEQNLFRQDSRGSMLRNRRQDRPRAGTGEGEAGAEEQADGGFEIASVRVVTATESAGGAAGEAALDVPMHIYDTVGRIDLPTPVAADGGQATVEIAFAFNFVPWSARMGFEEVGQGVIFEAAQWFPNVCVYDDVSGWNTLGYLGAGEFYTDFGDYEVNLTVPRSHLVVATGVLQNPEEVLTTGQRERLAQALASDETVTIRAEAEVADPTTRPDGDGPVTWRFKARDVRTFAWASSAAFIWDACGADTGPEGSGQRVLCQSFYPAEAAQTWKESTQYVRESIEHYSRWWYPYPYPACTNVNGREGGMEYPMLVFCGGRESAESLWGVTTHEVGHSWFPMVVNSNERQNAWMDEGFNTFINYYATREVHPEFQTRRGDVAKYAASNPATIWQPILTRPDHMARRMLGRLAYGKTATGLIVLREQILGPERFDYAFRTYIRRWAFKHPQPADFFRAMEDASGADLAWFWRGWFYGAGVLDQAVKDVRWDDDSRRGRIVFENRGELAMPMTYRVTYSNGAVEEGKAPVEVWAASDEWFAPVRLEGGVRVVKVEIDPEGGMPDVDRGNNVWER